MINPARQRQIVHGTLTVLMWVSLIYIGVYLCGFAWDLGVLLYELISEARASTRHFLGFALAVIIALFCYVATKDPKQ